METQKWQHVAFGDLITLPPDSVPMSSRSRSRKTGLVSWGVSGSHVPVGEPGERERLVILPASCFSSAVSTGAAIVCNEWAHQAGVSGVCGESVSGVGSRRTLPDQEVTQGPDKKRRDGGPGQWSSEFRTSLQRKGCIAVMEALGSKAGAPRGRPRWAFGSEARDARSWCRMADSEGDVWTGRTGMSAGEGCV